MNNCPVCKRDTAPIKIGGQSYCSECGTAATSAAPTSTPAAVPTPASAPATAARRISMDLAPRAAAPAAPAPTPAPRLSTSAAALHGRVKPSQILDLRQTTPTPVSPAQAPADVPVVPAETVTVAEPDKAVKAEVQNRQRTHLDNRLEKARQIERSAHIQKFGAPHTPAAETTAPVVPVAVPTTAPTAIVAAPPAPPAAPELEPEIPRHVITQHEAMAKLPQAPAAPTPPAPMAPPAKQPHFTAHHSRTFATVAAVALMGGYIWMSNYPKFALQNASNQAGLSASLPGYLPSSYTLSNTETRPGLVTLNFSSPSSSEPLKIAQHRTSWDSRSLLDNFVTRTTDDYSTVQSQGLTIYLFNNNQAAWVNRGIMYSIEGSSRLSREQILKIAYSL